MGKAGRTIREDVALWEVFTQARMMVRYMNDVDEVRLVCLCVLVRLEA